MERQWPELAIALFHHRNTLGQPMSFKTRSWLIPIYKDQANEIVVRKSVQCGLSDFAIIWALNQCRLGHSVLYALPNQDVRNDFVNNRIDPLLEDVDFYRAAMHGTDNTGLKHIWKGGMKIVGSLVRVAFKEFPAQALIVDELDECNQGNILFGVDRLAAAKSLTGKEPRRLYISNPTVSGYGIDERYKASDKKTWHIKCPHCNEWQSLDWFKNVVRQTDDNNYVLLSSLGLADAESVEDYATLCRFCNKPLDRLARGEWVAEYGDRDVSGYHISKLFTDQTTIKKMHNDFQRSMTNHTLKQWFYNSELGLPFEGEGDKLTYADLQKCAKDYIMPKSATNTVAGIDVGAVFHIRIVQLRSGKCHTVFIGTAPDIDDVIKILKRYNVGLFIIDALPELHLAKKLVDKYPKQGFMCWYGDGKSTNEKPDRKKKEITVNRTQSIDEMIAAHLDGLIELPKDWRSLDKGDFVSQMMAPTRILDMKRKPPAYVWDEAGQTDHHFHAGNYCHIGAKMKGFQSKSFGGLWV